MGDIINNPEFDTSGTLEEEKQEESEETPVESSDDEQTDPNAEPQEDDTSEESSEEDEVNEEEEDADEAVEGGDSEGDDSTDDDDEDEETTGLLNQKQKLRDEISDLRRERRSERGDDRLPTQVGPQTTQPQEKPQPDDDLSDYDAEEIERLDKFLKVKGYVKKGDIQATQQEDIEGEALSTFMDTHPEYDDDDLWAKFREESRFYARPTEMKPSESRKWYKTLFSKIHNSISGDSSSKTSQKEISKKKDTIKRAGVGADKGGGTTKVTSSKKGVSDKDRQHMQGWDDKELDDM